jgi:hypothetical protein
MKQVTRRSFFSVGGNRGCGAGFALHIPAAERR